MKDYSKLLEANVISTLSFGITEISISDVENIEKAQIGYGVDSRGEKIEAWPEHWIVIGHENLSGDPIFIDLEEEDIAVCTAMEGMGDWSEVLISKSLKGFIDSLQFLAHYSNQPPIKEDAKELIRGKLMKLSGLEELDFWENILFLED